MNTIIPQDRIEQAIYLIRGQKIMLDADLAKLYGVETRILIRNVKRNLLRFPSDFMFQLSHEEAISLRSQFGISKNKGKGGRRYLYYAFTEQGVAMLSSVLHSKRAIEVNIVIMRTFMKLRQMLASHAELAKRLNELERKYDGQFSVVFNALRKLMSEPEKPNRRIGFKT